MRILCAGLPASQHEIGLLLFSLAALTQGYRVLYLGADVPLGQVPSVVNRSAAHGVVLSARDEIDEVMHEELARLSGSIEVPLMLGGPCSDRPLDRFESAQGVRLGSRIAVALQVPLFGASEARWPHVGG